MRKLFAIVISFFLICLPIPNMSTAHAGVGGYAQVVLGMANGIVGSTILTKCAMGSSQPSILIYLTGSLVFVAAEVFGGETKRNQINQSAASLDELKANMKEGGDYQKAAIDAQIENEKGNLKHVQKKRKWMMATKVVYTAAAAMAFIEFIWSLPPPPAGPGFLKIDVAACSPNPAADVPVSEAIVLAYAGAQGYAGAGLMGAGLAVATPYVLKLRSLVKIGTAAANASVSMLNSSLGRFSFFGAAAALVMMIDGDLKKEEDRAKRNIADLEKIKAQFQDTDVELAEGSSKGGSKVAASANLNQNALKNLPKANEVGKKCFSQSNNTMNYSEEGCKNSYKLTKPKFDYKLDIPTLVAAANESYELGQAISDGDLSKAEISAGNLASMAGRMDAIYKGIEKKANDELKKQGKKPVDINGEINRQVAALNDALNKEKPGSGNLSLANIDGSTVGEASVSESKSPEGAGEIRSSNVAAASEASVPVPNASETDLSNIEAGLVENALTDESAKTASLSEGLEQFEAAEGDIAKDPDVSIFKQVSNRYFLNYTKLFNRKTVEPPLAEPSATAQPANN
jgi:hypothetical protein